ncbi:MAG TPA: transcriptional regulator [Planctomycetes bacterium]|nr:transcriptional regulator [Planctomycetota bacterium]
MTPPKRFENRPTEDLPAELVELGDLIREIDSDADKQQELQLLYNRVTESALRRRRILGLVQEALSQLRLDVKYLMFDLEVTCRERDELQARIEGEESGF